MANKTLLDSPGFYCNKLPRHPFFIHAYIKLEKSIIRPWWEMGATPSNNKIKSSLMSTSSHPPPSSPPFYLPPCLPPLQPTPPLSLTSSAGSGANLRVRAMPTYSLRRARFNTSKCCNASQLTLIIKACASPVPLPLSPPSPVSSYAQCTGARRCEPALLPAEKNTRPQRPSPRLDVNSCILRGNQ